MTVLFIGSCSELAEEFVFGFGQAVEAAPDEAVHADYHEADEDSCQEQGGEVAAVGGGVDLRSEADGGEGVVFEPGVFGEDRGVPGTAAGGDHAGDQIREDAGEDQGGPALPAGEAIERGGFAEVAGDGHGSGDDVEEDVPLGAEQHECY